MSCKKDNSDQMMSVASLSKIDPQTNIGKFLYSAISEPGRYDSVINEINLIGYVDWNKIVIDASSSRGNPLSAIVPVCGKSNTSDLLMFQFDSSEKLSNIKLLHWNNDVKDDNRALEKLKISSLVILSKLGLKIPQQPLTIRQNEYKRTNDQIAKAKERSAKLYSNKASPALINGNSNYVATEGQSSCRFIGEYHFQWAVAAGSEDMADFAYYFTFRNKIADNLYLALSNNLAAQNIFFQTDLSYFGFDFSGVNPPWWASNIPYALTSLFQQTMSETGLQMYPRASVYNVSITGNTSCSGDVDIDFPGGGGPGTNPGGSGTVSTIVNNNIVNPCLQAAVAAVIDPCFAGIIPETFSYMYNGPNSTYNLKIVEDFSKPRAGWTTPDAATLTATIHLNKAYMQDASAEYWSVVFLHELVHSIIMLQNKESNLVLNPIGQHQQMLVFWVNDLTQTMKSAYPGLTEYDARGLVLDGLTDVLVGMGYCSDSSWDAFIQGVYGISTQDVQLVGTNYQTGHAGIKCP